nr:(2Fe-2S)-binding protein [Ignatzschineria cameli]
MSREIEKEHQVGTLSNQQGLDEQGLDLQKNDQQNHDEKSHIVKEHFDSEKIQQRYPAIERKPLTLTINGEEVGPIEVPLTMTMIDFLHEYLDLTGTHFGCGQGICHACTVMEIHPDGSKSETRTCIFGAHYFAGKNIVTIEGQATKKDGVLILTPIQQAFIDNFAFQCGYCAPGFVAGATVFLDRLNRHPIKRANLEKAIEEALNDHICRCTGYVRYYEAIRDVALATPGCVID